MLPAGTRLLFPRGAGYDQNTCHGLSAGSSTTHPPGPGRIQLGISSTEVFAAYGGEASRVPVPTE